MGKVLFFDIDGTLYDFYGKIPDSAVEALWVSKEQGNTISVCTGRSYAQIYPELRQEGIFDAVVAAAGADVRYHGEQVAHHVFGADRLGQLIRFFQRNGIGFFLQCADRCLMPRKFIPVVERTFASRFDPSEPGPVIDKIEQALGSITFDDDPDTIPIRCADTESVIYVGSPLNHEEINRFLETLDLRATPSSFKKEADESCGEITLRGITKSSGMKELLDYLGLLREDSVAFGDGPNDYEMLEFAGTSVVMGNGVEGAKERADLITDDVNRDGLAKAMERLDLLDGETPLLDAEKRGE